MSGHAVIEAIFEYERSTKNTHKFLEAPGKPPISGTVYIQKWVFAKTPMKIRVTVEVIDE